MAKSAAPTSEDEAFLFGLKDELTQDEQITRSRLVRASVLERDVDLVALAWQPNRGVVVQQAIDALDLVTPTILKALHVGAVARSAQFYFTQSRASHEQRAKPTKKAWGAEHAEPRPRFAPGAPSAIPVEVASGEVTQKIIGHSRRPRQSKALPLGDAVIRQSVPQHPSRYCNTNGTARVVGPYRVRAAERVAELSYMRCIPRGQYEPYPIVIDAPISREKAKPVRLGLSVDRIEVGLVTRIERRRSAPPFRHTELREDALNRLPRDVHSVGDRTSRQVLSGVERHDSSAPFRRDLRFAGHSELYWGTDYTCQARTA